MGETASVTWFVQGEAAEIAECWDYVPPLYRPIHIQTPTPPDTRIFSSSWLSDAVSAGPQQFDIKVLTKIVSELESGMDAGSFDLISGLLRKLPYSDLSPQVIVTVLRVTHGARDYIPRWATALDLARATLSERGLNSERILRGL